MRAELKKRIKYSPLSRFATIPLRLHALSFTVRKLGLASRWVVRSRGWSNVGYDLSPDGLNAAAAALGVATGIAPSTLRDYAKELQDDEAFSERYRSRVSGTRLRYTNDPQLHLGKCLIYYMLVRSVRPQRIVEAGTLNGLGSLAICHALARNTAEGAPGRLVTLDIASDRGGLLEGDEGGLVTRTTGESVAAIMDMEPGIDCFIHDTVNQPEHARAQFAALQPKLADDAVILTSWFVEEFVVFCERNKLTYLEVAPHPLHHWYPGSRFGITSANPSPRSRRVAP